MTGRLQRILLLALPFFLLLQLIVTAQNVGISADLLAKALNHAAQNMPDAESAIQSLNDGDINALYAVAKSMNDAGNHIDSALIWHQLADGEAHHILSMVALGFTYSDEDKPRAAKYFVQAGEDGPHQAALYNAGRLFVEMDDHVRGLAYIRAAATLGGTRENAMYARPQMTETAKEAYGTLSNQLSNQLLMAALEPARGRLLTQDMIDMFPYANIDDYPREGSKEDKLWNNAMQKLQEYAKTKKQEQLEAARLDLSKLQDNKKLSRLQEHLLKGLLATTLEMVKDEL